MTSLVVHADDPLTGVPLVLLHAFPLDSRMWEGVLDRLPGVPVVRIDAPGFGGSAAGAPGLDAFAAEVVATVRSLGADRAVVAGLSMGGYVALAVAALAPEVLAGLGLLSTKASADPEAARQKRLDMVTAVERGEEQVTVPMLDALLGASTRADRPDVVEQVREWLQTAPHAGVVWAQRSMARRPDRIEALTSLGAVPVLVLRGTEDELMTEADAQAMADAVGVEVTEVVGAGHLVAVERPDEVAAALAELYRRATG